MIIGYARCSTISQSTLSQINELERFGCDKIYTEHVSAFSYRPEFDKCIASIRFGDVLICTSLSRLGRTIGDVLKVVEVVKERGATLRVLDMSLDTSSPSSVLILSCLSAVNTFEVSQTRVRQRAGIDAILANPALRRAKYKGRKPTARAKADLVLALLDRGVHKKSIAEQVGISLQSVYNIVRQASVQPEV